MLKRLADFANISFQTATEVIKEGGHPLPFVACLVHAEGFSYAAVPPDLMRLPEEIAVEVIQLAMQAARERAPRPTVGIVSLTVGQQDKVDVIGVVVEQPGGAFEQLRKVGEPLGEWRVNVAHDAKVRWLMEENRTYQSKEIHHA